MSDRPRHPPIDREILEQAIYPPGFRPGLRMDEIPERRRLAPVPSDDVLTRGGTILLDRRTVEAADARPPVPVVVLSPAGRPQGPGIVYLHGGGMVSGSVAGVDPSILDTVVESGTVVVSVDYRLAPENPHPAPVEDCFAALVWTSEHSTALGIDPTRLMIAGVSAGGGLAAATALMARDRGGPSLSHQILYCPMLDDRERFPSSTELDGVASWDRNANRTGWAALLGERAAGPDVDYYGAPSRAGDLRDLPFTFIDVGTVETFRDEAVDYAARLAQAGVPVELHVWPGGIHGFTTLAPDARISRSCRAARADFLRRACGRPA